MKVFAELPVGRLDPVAEQGFAYKLRSKSAMIRNAAARQLVLNSMREACLYAHRCCRGALPADEIFSLCYSALRRAAPNFRPGRIRFFAYCKVYVRSEICREWRGKGTVRNVPNESLIPWDHRQPFNSDFTRAAEKQGPRDPGADRDSERSVDFDFGSVDTAEQAAALQPLLRRVLSKREQRVIRLYYAQHLNFREIGVRLKCSRSWCQIVHARAIRKLRANASDLKGLL